MIISFWPGIKGDLNLWQFDFLTPSDIENLSTARGVIFPPTISKEIYFFIKELKIPHFPVFDAIFKFPGKIGNFLLIKSLGLPHPETVIVPRLCSLEENPYRDFPLSSLPFKFPFILKGNHGDEGREIFLIKNEKDWEETLRIVKTWEISGRYGFLLQEYISTPYDARALIIGKEVLVFFRSGGLKKNLVQEGEVISCPKKGLKKKILALTRRIIEETGLNHVAIDFLIKDGEVLVNELNHTFGRRFLGEKRYERLVKKAVKEFSTSLV